MFLGLKLVVLLPIVAILLALRWRKAGMLTWSLAWVGACWVVLRFGFVTPVPASVVKLYMGIVLLSMFAYVTSSRDRREEFTRPIVDLAVNPRRRALLAAVLVLVPLLAGFNVYMKVSVPLEAPQFGRTIHPAPPDAITVHDREISLITADNPYRHLEDDEPEVFAAHVQNGRRVYYQNCFYCHGDFLGGDGMFAYGLNPIPSNFTDQGVLPMLQESFLFWRISKGAPGLPEEGGPWDSAMPAWEKHLTEEEMWDVILFLYEFTDYRPRARGEHHE
jgi:mono/diheme cytochrome c family protein